MKSRFKFISFSLLLILVLTLSFGCTPNDKSNDKDNTDNLSEDISMELGFLDEKYIKDDEQFIKIGANGKTLELKILDNDLFDSLESKEFYMVSYNKENIVKSIETNKFIKTLVVDSMNQDINSSESNKISKSEKFDTKNLTLLDAFIIDIDNDGEDEKIAMYTRAEKEKNGDIIWDDGQDWIVLVEGKDKDYVLFNDYVQLGNIDLFVYTIEDDFYIAILQSSTANLTLKEYKFNSDKKEFEANVRFNTTGNVNMLHNSK